MKNSVYIFVLIPILLLSSGCAERNETENSDPIISDAAKDPHIQEQLRVGLILWDTPAEVSKEFSDVEDYLSSELDMEVNTIRNRDYHFIIDAMTAGELDIAFFGPFSSVIAAERSGSEIIIAGGNSKGDLDTYQSYIITSNNTGINSIDELITKRQDINFAFVNPASTSGNLVPRAYFLSNGVDPDEDFKTTLFSSGHDKTMESILSGNVVDAGSVASTAYERYIEKNNVSENDIVILWRSDPIPPNPVAARGDMDPLFKEKIKKAFLNMPVRSPETFYGFMEVRDGHAMYIEANNSDYEIIREMAISLEYI